MPEKLRVNVFWFRRDLRLSDNVGLYHALTAGLPVVGVFIFDKDILDKLQDPDDGRVTFIYNTLTQLNDQLKALGSSILFKYDYPKAAWEDILKQFDVQNIFCNRDYEPYARSRDQAIEELASSRGALLRSYKDQVIFETNEVVKEDGNPYTVFSPYKRKWLSLLKTSLPLKTYASADHTSKFIKIRFEPPPSLSDMGFQESLLQLPAKAYKDILNAYAEQRDYPAVEGTSRLGVHLRFGTVSIRELTTNASEHSEVWLSELIWRDFYSMILWHFPETRSCSFKREFDAIQWRNDEEEFAAWCDGKTGYPLVDAGMRQLNSTGWMHNRVRMVVASFLCKHLLIDWRWGEAYFARKLLDYEQASNVGGWQWAAGTGNDAAPYFRIFNPELQTKRFDPQGLYIKKWIPEVGDPFKYPVPIVEHKFARARALQAYQKASATRP